jgi:hypothetical protein
MSSPDSAYDILLDGKGYMLAYQYQPRPARRVQHSESHLANYESGGV